MHWRGMRRGGRLALAALAATVAATAPALADDGVPREAWHTWSPAGPQRDEELRGVAARGPADAWAVGYRENTAGVDVPVAERFDGRAWRATSVTGHSGAGQLDAVLPLSGRDVWAVGTWNDAPAAQDRSLAEHFDGRVWRSVPLPQEPADRSAYPSALAAVRDDDVWAVGVTAEDRVGTPRPLAYHWDGHSWTSVPTPGTGGDAMLQGATADGAGGVWAVGVAYDAQGAGRPLTEHWNGRSWRIVDAPHTAGQGESLTAVTAVAPDDVWAVGGGGPADGTSHPLSLHWDGRSWTPVAVPKADANLHAVSADSRGGLWAVGEQQGVDTPAFTMRWNGRAWRIVPAATGPDGKGASLFGVTTVPHARPGGPSAWAVGSTLPRLQPTWHPVIEGFGAAPAPTS
ncbi:hypothetical protein [Streptomyces sp. NBC_01766]|uniref:hypothetical protein n=1 Tax=Streptomyces sp. NBC_01766 TaxID=2975936 RepID=UPI002DD803DA|nr:hypothetical protein [Streptomyces sp. NBC_01766]WSC24105.1 hypothetical protein OIE60_32970 [Streptomyces sp. NBC_01766]